MLFPYAFPVRVPLQAMAPAEASGVKAYEAAPAQLLRDQPYMEQALAEAVLPQVGWRAEATAAIPVMVRGGVLADKVGYGKTALTVGLHDIQRQSRDVPEINDPAVRGL